MVAMSPPRPFHTASRRAAALLLFGLLAGCGRKGDLYLPDEDEAEKRPTVTQPPGSTETVLPPGPNETETLPDLEED